MRLICGICQLNGAPVTTEMLRSMCRAMQSPLRASRVAVWLGGCCGLGVVDFDREATAPLILESESGAVLAADIRLDDPATLRGAMGLPGLGTDAGLAAEVLDRQGAAGAAELAGDVALAQWMPRERRLLLVRDALGIRPLAYHHTPGERFVFASSPAGIFGSGLVERMLDDAALAREAVSRHSHESSLFVGVHEVRPGQTIAVTPAGVERKVYWQPKRQARRHRRTEDAVEELRGLLHVAVTCRLGVTAPVAAHLSGGLDSSSIAVMAARGLSGAGRALYAYSFLGDAWPGVPFDDEAPFIQAVLRQEPSIRWKRIEAALTEDWLHDEYFPDRAVSTRSDTPEHTAFGDASEQGAAVLLSGWGGDEGITFNGRGALAAAFKGFRWGYLSREMVALRRQRGFRLRNTFIGDVLQPLLPAESMNRVRRTAGRPSLIAVPSGKTFIQPHLHPQIEQADFVLGPDPLRNQLALLTSPHLAYRTTTYAMMAARHGMAVSFPLLDRRVVEFALSIPPDWHIRDGWKRALVRDAMKGVLPPEIERRHTKLAPIPRLMFEYAKKREEICQRVAELAAHPVVSRIFDMGTMAAVAASIPPVQRATGPGDVSMVPTFSRAFTCAMYVEQMF